MLTATYSLIAISNEQNAFRRILRSAQQSLQSSRKSPQQPDPAVVSAVFDQLMQFNAFFHARKVERYLIPAIRSATQAADSLLAELDLLTAGAKLPCSTSDLPDRRFADDMQLIDVQGALEIYCRRMMSRLAREEDELFPLARKILSTEEWFAVAEKFLSDDRRALLHQRHAPHFVALLRESARASAH